MSASWSGSMRGPWMKTPFLLLLLLLLLSTLTGTVLCQSEDGEDGEEAEAEQVDENEGTDIEPTEQTPADPDSTSPTPIEDQGTGEETTTEEHGSGQDHSRSVDDDYTPSTTEPTADSITPDGNGSPEEDESLSPIIILIPVVLVVVIIGMIVCGIFINRKWNKKARNQELGKEDPYLDGSSTEKVPMPMFEEDVPSVLELEMEELDQWMKKDAGSNIDRSSGHEPKQ